MINKSTKTSIAWKFRVLNIAFFAVMTAVLLLVFNIIINNIANRVSKDYARLHSIDAVHKFNIYLKHEIELVENAASLESVAKWFANESDTAKKRVALEDLAIYGSLLFSHELYFVIHESLNEYSIYIENGIDIDTIKPFDVISPHVEYDQWYFRAIESKNNYELNIDIDKVTNERRLWINHKVVRDGKVLGVFCSGMRFDDVVAGIFNLSDTGSVRSVIINENGIIQMNSLLMSQHSLRPYSVGLSIRNTGDDPTFLSHIDNYLNNISGIFGMDDEAIVFKTQRGNTHRYVSIAPITYSNWSVITFFNPESLQSSEMFYPLIFVALAVLILCAVFITSLSSKMIFNPFHKFIGNLSSPSIGGHVYDNKSQDEFYEISKTFEYAQLLFDTSPLCCTMINGNYKVIECNKEAAVLFGLSGKKEYVDRFFDLSPKTQPCGENSKKLALAKIKSAFDNGYCRFEWMHQIPDGTPLPCEITLIRVKFRNEFHVAGYTKDLREQKAFIEKIENAKEDMRRMRDAAEAANLAKTTFLATMSHEIRTPLNSIIGFGELAHDKSLPQKTQDYLNKITDNAKWLLLIINDILDISKIESGNVELERVPFKLNDILERCHAAILQKAEEKGLTLYFQNETPANKKLLGDPTKLRQVISNLLSNAVKFTNIGMIKLKTSLDKEEDGKATVRFEVKDSGIGMDDEQIAKIFSPFMQGDNSITRKFGGTGLGLAITRDIIKMMGGELFTESVPGIGSKFSFVVTFDVTNENTADNTNDRVLEKPTFEGEILVCEDNAMNQQVICEHLDNVGIKAVVAENGKTGLDIVTKRKADGKKPFNLILMDIHMPEMDGLETATKIMELKIPTPIVAMTASIMPDDIEQYKKCGISDSLGKPFTAQELWKCLSKYFTTISVTPIDKTTQDADDEQMLLHLRTNFVNSNQTKYADIMKAIDLGDIKLAHRLCHTLKSNAGQIKEHALQKAAANAEAALTNGANNITEKECSALKAELDATLEKLSPYLSSKHSAYATQSGKETHGILDMLEQMLINRNPECMNLLDDIRAISGTEELAMLIEDFEFKRAAAELARLKENIIK